MKRIESLVMCGWLLAGWAISSGAQSNITLVADADTCIQEHRPTTQRSTNVIEVRSRNVAGSGRQNIAYIRFDLGELANAPEAGAVFSITGAGSGGTFADGEIHVYGLLDTFGNTPQAWVDSGLTYNTSGLEVPGDGDGTTQDLEASRLQYLGDLPGNTSNAETVLFSSAALDAFLADRHAGAGLATLMVVSEADIDVELQFNNSENTSAPPPSLDVVGEVGTPGGDTTPPTVAGGSPTDGAVDVDVDVDVRAIFSEAMDPASITTNTFVLMDQSNNTIAVSVAYVADRLTATLSPESALAATSSYTATVMGGPGGVTDLATNAMVANFSWSFTTGEPEPVDPTAPIRLVPDADTRLSNDSNRGPTSSNGGSSVWEVRWHTAPRVRIGYLRYDISDIDPARFSTATISGTFRGSSYNNAGLWNVYGLNDDVVADGAGRLGNDWDEGSANFSNAAGVDNASPIGTFTILTNETMFLGTIAPDGIDEQPLPFASNPTDLNLTAFLSADTDGLVTFLIVEAVQGGNEYQIDSKEGNSADGHGPTTLNFVPGASAGPAITDLQLSGGTSIVVTWEARPNRYYGVERSIDAISTSNWVEVATNLVGASVNTYTDTVPVEAQVTYRVRDEGLVPPEEYFFDDFETGAPDWTVRTGATHQAGTDWELGTPSGASGPGGALEGDNAYATNLGGDFGPDADISLLSPVVDLTTAGAANLSFGNFYDFDGLDDFGHVYVRDESGAEIPALAAPIATYDGYISGWTISTIELPAEALGRTVRFEFQFISDALVEYAGWYLDNVRVGQ